MLVIMSYNGKALTVNGFYALKYTEIPNSQLGISVIPTSSKQGIIQRQLPEVNIAHA